MRALHSIIDASDVVDEHNTMGMASRQLRRYVRYREAVDSADPREQVRNGVLPFDTFNPLSDRLMDFAIRHGLMTARTAFFETRYFRGPEFVRLIVGGETGGDRVRAIIFWDNNFLGQLIN